MDVLEGCRVITLIPGSGDNSIGVEIRVPGPPVELRILHRLAPLVQAFVVFQLPAWPEVNLWFDARDQDGPSQALNVPASSLAGVPVYGPGILTGHDDAGRTIGLGDRQFTAFRRAVPRFIAG